MRFKIDHLSWGERRFVSLIVRGESDDDFLSAEETEGVLHFAKRLQEKFDVECDFKVYFEDSAPQQQMFDY